MREELNQLAADYLQVLRSKPSKVASTEEALKDIIPIDWSDDILDGTRKITVSPDESRKSTEKDGVPWIAE